MTYSLQSVTVDVVGPSDAEVTVETTGGLPSEWARLEITKLISRLFRNYGISITKVDIPSLKAHSGRDR